MKSSRRKLPGGNVEKWLVRLTTVIVGGWLAVITRKRLSKISERWLSKTNGWKLADNGHQKVVVEGWLVAVKKKQYIEAYHHQSAKKVVKMTECLSGDGRWSVDNNH